ncbi:MAG TPA: hypothetical protein VHC97_19830 [Thermoanaerobaculia bacterium]|jgi:hypothetical protein|nr:hypothetical protein [Thermoanaerobaculia bacterium]
MRDVGVELRALKQRAIIIMGFEAYKPLKGLVKKKLIERIAGSMPDYEGWEEATSSPSLSYFGELVRSPLSTRDYFQQWMHHVTLGFIDSEQASMKLLYALEQAKDLTTVEKQELLDTFWAERWIIDYRVCGSMRFHLLASLRPGPEELEQESRRVFRQLENDLRQARESSQTLDEWLEGLFPITPRVIYALQIFRQQDSDNSKAMKRMVDEMGADIGTLFGTVCVNILKGEREFFSEYALSGLVEDPTDVRALKRGLSYGYRGRIRYPRFWYEEILKFVERADLAELPAALNAIDVRHAVSIALVNAPVVLPAFLKMPKEGYDSPEDLILTLDDASILDEQGSKAGHEDPPRKSFLRQIVSRLFG